LRRALHEEDDGVAFDDLVDLFVRGAHGETRFGEGAAAAVSEPASALENLTI
jgi:hypothetical protein